MKLIALRDFSNVKSLKGYIKIPASEKVHDNHVHKGFTFEIGTKDSPKEMQESGELNEAIAAAHLIYAGCAGDATDEKIVKRVKDEITVDKKREATAAKLDEEASKNSAGEALTRLIEQLTAKAAAK